MPGSGAHALPDAQSTSATPSAEAIAMYVNANSMKRVRGP
jgi:hypothetical protein